MPHPGAVHTSVIPVPQRRQLDWKACCHSSRQQPAQKEPDCVFVTKPQGPLTMTVSVISQPTILPCEICYKTFVFLDQSPLRKGREAFVSGTKYKEAPRNSFIGANTARDHLSVESANSRVDGGCQGLGPGGQGRGQKGAPTFSGKMNKV